MWLRINKQGLDKGKEAPALDLDLSAQFDDTIGRKIEVLDDTAGRSYVNARAARLGSLPSPAQRERE
jgi:hypothetical protein